LLEEYRFNHSTQWWQRTYILSCM